ncbi:unnamed protein product [Peniophora sp. CBMAI 1063]|nr:unnamed protein product [Peniophora sp. CBMAI 1063]
MDPKETAQSQRAGWTTNQRQYERALVDGPTAAIDRFRTTFQNRAPGPLSKDDEVVKLADVLNVRLFEAFGDTLELRRAIMGSNIVPFLVDIMAEPDFLRHYLGFSSSICGMILGHFDVWLSAARTTGFGGAGQTRSKLAALGFPDVFWSKMQKAWIGLWENRSHLAESDDVRFRLALLEQIELLAFSVRDLEMQLALNPKGSKELSQVAFFVWAQLHGNEAMTEKDILQLRSQHHAPVILWDYYGSSPTMQASVRDIFENVGVDRSIRATENTLKWSFLMTGTHLLACIKLVTLLHNVYMSSPLLSNTAVLPAMAMAFERQKIRLKYAESQGQGQAPGVTLAKKIHAIHAACEHIKIIFLAVHAHIAQSSILPANAIQAVWSIFLQTIDMALEADELRLSRKNSVPMEDNLSSLTSSLSQATDSLVVALNEGGLPSDIIASLRKDAAAQTEGTSTWYCVVPDLHRVIKAKSPYANTFITLLDAWRSLGKALGIDEITERDRRASYQARICSWRACAFHTTPSPSPLSTCKGCHETRYCSKDCQTRDWKQGGHREECRRLKKE